MSGYARPRSPDDIPGLTEALEGKEEAGTAAELISDLSEATSEALDAKLDASALPVLEEADARRWIQMHNQRALARWYAVVAAKQASKTPIHIWAGIDSLTAGNSGTSWLPKFRRMAQAAYGDAGWGFQPPTNRWEAGGWGFAAENWTVEEFTAGNTDGSQFGASVSTLLYESGTPDAATFTLNISQIDRDADTVDVYYLTGPGQASSARIRATTSLGTSVDVDASGEEFEVGKVSLTTFGRGLATRSTVISVDSISGGEFRILGLNFKRTAASGGISVHRWAVSGSKTQDWAGLDAESMQYYFENIGLDLLILNGGSNEKFDSASGYRDAVETLIANAQMANPDVTVLLMTPPLHPTNPGNLPDFIASLYDLAIEYNCPLLDWSWVFGDLQESLELGYLNDLLHPSDSGTSLIAHALMQLLLPFRMRRPAEAGEFIAINRSGDNSSPLEVQQRDGSVPSVRLFSSNGTHWLEMLTTGGTGISYLRRNGNANQRFELANEYTAQVSGNRVIIARNGAGCGVSTAVSFVPEQMLDVDGHARVRQSVTLDSITDSAALNNSLFRSSDHSGKLCWKDNAGTVHELY